MQIKETVNEGLQRTFEVTGDVLRYTFRMAAVGTALTHHLAATLHRTS